MGDEGNHAGKYGRVTGGIQEPAGEDGRVREDKGGRYGRLREKTGVYTVSIFLNYENQGNNF